MLVTVYWPETAAVTSVAGRGGKGEEEKKKEKNTLTLR